jgi:hypothetical protein
LDAVFGIFAFILICWFLVWFAILLPHRMAKNRNREAFAWVLVSLIGSPFLAIFALLILGQKDK